MNQQKNKIDWIITLEANDCSCRICGRKENKFIDGFCNAKTEGMYKYNHPEFQLVICMEYKMILYTLNNLGLMVQSGRKFKDGDLVDELFEGYQVQLKEVKEDGEQLLRILIPDANHKFPNDSDCQQIYSYQALPIEDLYIANKNKREN